jgi:hypothetical protein
MFHIGQHVVCIDDIFPGENGVCDPTFAERCPNLPVKGGIYTVRGFVVPYAEYPGTPGMLLEEVINPPSRYLEGTFEPSFFPSHFRPATERRTDISVFTDALRLPKIRKIRNPLSRLDVARVPLAEDQPPEHAERWFLELIGHSSASRSWAAERDQPTDVGHAAVADLVSGRAGR